MCFMNHLKKEEIAYPVWISLLPLLFGDAINMIYYLVQKQQKK